VRETNKKQKYKNGKIFIKKRGGELLPWKALPAAIIINLLPQFFVLLKSCCVFNALIKHF
jgi:hypothetical protein